VIQRIQSVFLFFAFILDGSIFFNALYKHAVNDPQQWIGIIFAVLLTLAALASLGSIFLYKNRTKQIAWVKRTIMIQIAALGCGVGIFISLGGFGPFLWDEAIGIMMLLLAFSAQLYAKKKIQDDLELVESMDRIR